MLYFWPGWSRVEYAEGPRMKREEALNLSAFDFLPMALRLRRDRKVQFTLTIRGNYRGLGVIREQSMAESKSTPRLQ